ncbi:MAG TPA: tetratricopeptide repeat protein [Rhizomicrobium sp.]|jgi:tetratricopeptide (TPR) repeat protein|nr:tetratricopeptide repeat protein [Rhizomicrobium sp.]
MLRLPGGLLCAACIVLVPFNAANARNNCFDRPLPPANFVIEACSQIIASTPNEPLPYINRAMAYFGTGKTDAALADLDKALNGRPKWGPIYLDRASIYLSMNKYDLAIADLDKAIEYTSELNLKDMAIRNRSQAFLEKGEIAAAEADASQAISNEPKNPTGYLRRGYIFLTQNNLDAARGNFEYALQLDRFYIPSLLSLGSVELVQGNGDAALKNFDEAIRVDRDAGTLARRCFARAFLKQDFGAAMSDCNEAAAKQPENAYVFDIRAFLYLQMQRYDDAIKDYNAALVLNPHLASSLYGRNVAERASGDISKADADLASAKSINANIEREFGKPIVLGVADANN